MEAIIHDEKAKFLWLVESYLFKHPEWLPETISAASRGILNKIDEERKVSVNIQTSLHLLYEYRFGKMNPANQQKVLESILECDVIQGTKFAEKIREKLTRKAGN